MKGKNGRRAEREEGRSKSNKKICFVIATHRTIRKESKNKLLENLVETNEITRTYSSVKWRLIKTLDRSEAKITKIRARKFEKFHQREKDSALVEENQRLTNEGKDR